MQLTKPIVGALFLLLGFAPAQSATPSISSVSSSDAEVESEFKHKAALKASQAAIGTKLSNHRFMTSNGSVLFMEELRGKPLLISLIYTSCYHTCPMITRNLAEVVEKARDALGEESFNIALIGFDTNTDTPGAMRYFGRQQGVNGEGWKLLSTDKATIDSLTKELGFIYYPSSRGFDHLVQATVVDEHGEIYRQVYGEVINTPQLIEPLKELVFGRPVAGQSLLTDIVNRVKLFCTIYDPNRDAYIFDYSLFLQALIGLSILIPGFVFVVRAWRRTG
ncbi:hypothetical protein MNBD_GAMMA26-551 [hydrothermal vent metagenome]|uniref:Thioredoxin domain-containing protein n=1 Tax=hydrothermal vent metagenome TaxID=652676 RepID=A0A3B1AQY5_9ZZZZ